MSKYQGKIAIRYQLLSQHHFLRSLGQKVDGLSIGHHSALFLSLLPSLAQVVHFDLPVHALLAEEHHEGEPALPRLPQLLPHRDGASIVQEDVAGKDPRVLQGCNSIGLLN